MINRIIIFLTLLLLTQIKLQSQPQSDRIFDYLNLDYPGLSKVKNAVENRDFSSAKAHLLTYFRERSNRKVDFKKYFNNPNFSKANQNSQNIFDIKTYKHDFGEQINWKTSKEEKEWQFSLSRMEWFLNFVAVYQKTKDEKYVQSWMNQCESFIQLNEPGFPRTIDTGRRMESWVITHWMFLHELKSESITPEFNARFLLSLADQAEYIYKPENWRRFSNWGTFENSGLSMLVILFPEFKDNAKWLREIFYRMRSQLKDSYYSDGLHIETAPSYHLHELQVWFNFIKLAEMNNVADPWKPQIEIESNKDLILPKALAIMQLYNPSGVIPQISDSDVTDEKESVSEISDYWKNDELKFVATNGTLGKKPEKNLASFPKGGYTIMRSGWGSDECPYNKELYLLFDHGNNKPWHAHFDIFNVVASGFGFDLLVDPGRFTYTDGKEREQFISTDYHNTVTVDSKNQIKNYSAGPAESYELNNSIYVTANCEPYLGVNHRRSIFFNKEYWIITDRLKSETKHTYTQNWHLSDRAISKTAVNIDKREIETPNLLIEIPNPSAITIVDGEISYEYRKKISAPVVRCTAEGTNNALLPVIIYPFEKTKPIIEVQNNIRSLNNQNDVLLTVSGQDFKDYYYENGSTAAVSSPEINTDAKVVYIRTDVNGAIKNITMFKGSYLQFNNDELFAIQGENVSAYLSNGTIEIIGGCVNKIKVNKSFAKKIVLNKKELQVKQDSRYFFYNVPEL